MRRVLLLIRLLGLVLATIALGACSVVGHTPVTRTLWDAIPGLGRNPDAIRLNPGLRYLRVTVGGRVVFMVLGYIEPEPEGEIQVWYSGEGEVIRLQNGRIVGTAGLETDWRAVRNASLPAWKELAGRASADYSRERDEMPGYRYGIAERLKLYAIPFPYNSKLVGLRADSLRWYEEAVLGQPDGLASGRFALNATKDGEPLVVYGEQCLSQQLCLAWQLWAAQQ